MVVECGGLEAQSREFMCPKTDFSFCGTVIGQDLVIPPTQEPVTVLIISRPQLQKGKSKGGNVRFTCRVEAFKTREVSTPP